MTKLKPIRVTDGLWHDLPTCPHCGMEDTDWQEEKDAPKNVWDGDEWTVKCFCCSREYFVTLCISATFQTHKEIM